MTAIRKLFVAALIGASALSAHAGTPFSAKQVWKGSYKCHNGETALTLRIKSVAKTAVDTDLGKAYAVEAVFDFDFNNRAAAGAFHVAGNYYPESNVTVLDPGAWIRQPPGYQPVGMDGKVSADGRSYTGKILFQGCKGFELELAS